MVLSGVKTGVAVILLMCVAKASANPCAGINSGFVNDFSGCRNYFSCVNTIAFPVQCPLGLYFDEENQICDLEANVECARCPPTGTVFTRSPNSCSAYTMCINGSPIDRECATGLWFDIPTNRCALIADVACEGINNCPATGVAVVPDLTNCQRFITCSNGEVVDNLECGAELWFDSKTLNCVVATECPT